MDIAALSMNLAQTNLLNDVGTAVLSKSLEQAQDTGSAITQMLLPWSILYILSLVAI